jgi:lycopene cyclase domain-containing protein
VTYSGFLLWFLAIPLVLLLLFLRRYLRRFHKIGLGLVCLLAFVYTTPWDNYAAYKRLWSFDPAFVWGRPFWVGYLPLEEYLFYLAEAIFVCFIVVALARIPWLAPQFDTIETENHS